MTPYEQMIERVVDSGVIFEQYPSKKFSSASFELEKQYAIFMNDRAFKSDGDRRTALGHEKAHCDNGAVHKATASLSERSRCEYRANKSAVLELVPFEDFCGALLNRINDVGEQAEYWNVSVDFVPIVHDVYQRTRWDDLQKLKQQLAEEDDW